MSCGVLRWSSQRWEPEVDQIGRSQQSQLVRRRHILPHQRCHQRLHRVKYASIMARCPSIVSKHPDPPTSGRTRDFEHSLHDEGENDEGEDENVLKSLLQAVAGSKFRLTTPNQCVVEPVLAGGAGAGRAKAFACLQDVNQFVVWAVGDGHALGLRQLFCPIKSSLLITVDTLGGLIIKLGGRRLAAGDCPVRLHHGGEIDHALLRSLQLQERTISAPALHKILWPGSHGCDRTIDRGLMHDDCVPSITEFVPSQCIHCNDGSCPLEISPVWLS